MKSNTFFVLIIVLIYATYSCEKKPGACSYPIVYHNPSIAFVGFSETEMKTISISTYKAKTNFSELVDIDSLVQSSMEFLSDTAYASIDTVSKIMNGFKNIGGGFDYKIQCNQTGKTFIITNVRSGEDRHTWISDHCPNDARRTQYFSVLFDLDGIPAYPGNNGYTLYLIN